VSLATTIGAGALLGTVLAVGVYNVVAPSDAVPASVEVAPTYAPVPTPTVTEEAEDCVDPAVLEDDECVVHKPGPTVTVTPAPVRQPQVAAPAPAPAAPVAPAAAARATSEGYGEHEDGDHEESDHEDGDHEDRDHEDGEHHDDGDEHDD
jgi:hypothetical protein